MNAFMGGLRQRRRNCKQIGPLQSKINSVPQKFKRRNCHAANGNQGCSWLLRAHEWLCPGGSRPKRRASTRVTHTGTHTARQAPAPHTPQQQQQQFGLLVWLFGGCCCPSCPRTSSSRLAGGVARLLRVGGWAGQQRRHASTGASSAGAALRVPVRQWRSASEEAAGGIRGAQGQPRWWGKRQLGIGATPGVGLCC